MIFMLKVLEIKQQTKAQQNLTPYTNSKGKNENKKGSKE